MSRAPPSPLNDRAQHYYNQLIEANGHSPPVPRTSLFGGRAHQTHTPSAGAQEVYQRRRDRQESLSSTTSKNTEWIGNPRSTGKALGKKLSTRKIEGTQTLDKRTIGEAHRGSRVRELRSPRSGYSYEWEAFSLNGMNFPLTHGELKNTCEEFSRDNEAHESCEDQQMRASIQTVKELGLSMDPSTMVLPSIPGWAATASKDDRKACVRLNGEMKKNLATAAKELSKVSNSMWAINTVRNGTVKTEVPLKTGPQYYGLSFCGSARDRTRKKFMAQSKVFQEIYDSATRSIHQLGESKSREGAENRPEDTKVSILDNEGTSEGEEIIPDDAYGLVVHDEQPEITDLSVKRTSNEIANAATIFVEEMKNKHPLTMFWPQRERVLALAEFVKSQSNMSVDPRRTMIPESPRWTTDASESDKIRCLGIAAQMRAELGPTEQEWKRLSADWLNLKGTIKSGSGPIQLSVEQTKASDKIRNDLLSQGVGFRSILRARNNKVAQLGRDLKRERAETSAVAGTAPTKETAGGSEGTDTRRTIDVTHRLQQIAYDFGSEIVHEAAPTQIWPQKEDIITLLANLVIEGATFNPSAEELSYTEPGWSKNASPSVRIRLAEINKYIRRETASVTEDLEALWNDYTGLKNSDEVSGGDRGEIIREIFDRLKSQGQRYMTICSTVKQELSKLDRDGGQTMSEDLVRGAAGNREGEVDTVDEMTEDQGQGLNSVTASRAEIGEGVETTASLPDRTKAE